jgi:hypothetical protein
MQIVRSEVAPRGVRLADYTIDGQRVLEAISSRGERVAQVPVPPDAIEAVVREWLWGFLDGMDPRPTLLRSA